MGRFAKALSRKHEKKYKKSEERVEAAEKKSKHAVRHATTKQLIKMRRKTPALKDGDIRRVRRICVSN